MWVVKATPRQFILGNNVLDTHSTGSWVEPRAVLDGCKNILPPPEFETRTVRPIVDLLRRGGTIRFTQRGTYFE
jgi:hypothetical protein